MVELVVKASPGGGLSLVVGKAARLAAWTTGTVGKFSKTFGVAMKVKSG